MNPRNPRPIDVEPVDDYRLLITFENNEKKIFDVTPLLGFPIYRQLKDKGFFSLAKADGMCVFWNDDIDICPDVLYEKSVLYN